MIYIIEALNPKYINSVLQYGAKIEDMIKQLEQKGNDLAETVKTLKELEGVSLIKGGLHILVKCPMVPVLESVKKANAEFTGEPSLPDFYPQLVEAYINKHPFDAGVLHPLCIAHQQIRKAFGAKHGLEIQQIACRSDSGEVVYSQQGLKAAGLTEAQACKEIGENACLFICKNKK
jgi:hypothetical protein